MPRYTRTPAALIYTKIRPRTQIILDQLKLNLGRYPIRELAGLMNLPRRTVYKIAQNYKLDITCKTPRPKPPPAPRAPRKPPRPERAILVDRMMYLSTGKRA